MSTNLYLTRPASLKAHALSAAVGSGKTRAAVAFMARADTATRNFLYVAPTIRLVSQTAKNLREAIALTKGPTVRNVNLLHSENTEGGVTIEALRSVNEVQEQEGRVEILTTATFLAIVSRITRPELWSVILDEAFDPARFTTFRLGRDELGGWAFFSELFAVDPQQGHRIVCREGKRALVEDVAAGGYRIAGDKFSALQPVASAVANPAMRCELVMTDKAAALLRGEAPTTRKATKASAEPEGSVLQFSSYVAPEAFAGFREVLFLSALFEETILYHLWSKALGVTFEQHRDFPVELLRDTHAEQGRFLAVGHLLHPEDNASKENLGRDLATGAPIGARAGDRVVDQLIRTAAGHFSGPFLLQVNKGYSIGPGSPLVPSTAVLIPAYAHGLDDFQGVDNVAALCVTNPNPQQLAWVRSRTGMSAKAVTMSYRIHACYQALGRCSIRRKEPTTDPKAVLTVGADDARFIHDLFPGSRWLGQVGHLPKLKRLEAATKEREPSKINTLAGAITAYLQTIDPSIDRITSRGLRCQMEAASQPTISSPIALGATSELRYGRDTWSEAIGVACASGVGWSRSGQGLDRFTFPVYTSVPRPQLPEDSP